jgi:LAO/AO transport system kinase
VTVAATPSAARRRTRPSPPAAPPAPGPGEGGLAAGVAAGDSLSLARAITLVEDRGEEGAALLAALAPATGRAYRLGVTGPPGAGKSTLVNALARALAAEGGVGILAVDPTSPFTGGALLGDRVRMGAASAEPGVFIRSMASRGDLGGLAAAAQDACDLMDASGRPWVLVETVGVGQTEVEVAGAADTVLVVLHPESGDGVQAMKAGLMEVADVFVINKADREGADRLVRDVLDTLEFRAPDPHGWKPPVLPAVASTGKGVPEVLAAVRRHREHARACGSFEERRRSRARTRIRERVEEALRRRILDAGAARLDALAAEVVQGRRTPSDAADELLRTLAPAAAPTRPHPRRKP